MEAAKRNGNIPMNIGHCGLVEEKEEGEEISSPETPPLPSRIPMPVDIPEHVALPKRIPVPSEAREGWKSQWGDGAGTTAAIVTSPSRRYWEFGKEEEVTRGGVEEAPPSQGGRQARGIRWDSGGLPSPDLWQLPPVRRASV